MVNKDKYIQSINKIKIDEKLVGDVIMKVKESKKVKSNIKFKMMRQVVLTAAAMFIFTIVSFASYVAISKDTRILEKFGITLEGMEEEVPVEENKSFLNEDVEYTIQYPDDMIFRKDGRFDIYECKDDSDEPNENGVVIPKVYMKIYSIDEDECAKTSEGLMADVSKYKSNYSSVEEVEIGKNNYKAMKYNINKGMKWNSEVNDVYVVNVNENSRLIIEISYFVEATEGYGTVLNSLVETLEIK